MRHKQTIYWREILWPRPFSEDAERAVLTHLATLGLNTQIIFEARAAKGKIRWLVGAEPVALSKVMAALKAELPAIRFETKEEHVRRVDMAMACSVRISHPTLSLNTNNTGAIIRATLASLAQTRREGDETVLQVLLGTARTPSLLPNRLSDPRVSWLDALRGTVGEASGDSRRLMREKAEYHGFESIVRIGAVTKSDDGIHNRAHIRAVFAGLKTAESAGARLRLNPERVELFNTAARPWRYPMRLSIRELPAFLCWPIGNEEFSGVAGLHPRPLLPPENIRVENSRSFGVDLLGKSLGISTRDALEHTVFLGPTGAGKSNAMLSLVMADINAGRSVFVIDPKQDLVNNILERIPPERDKDVVVVDPSDPCPVGVNPLTGSRNPALLADAILAVFQDLFTDAWGIRTQDILSAALLTLVKVPGASLVWLPALLTDANFRRKITEQIHDPIGLSAFWAGFEALSNAERNQHISPVLNKVRQFLLRPELRAMLGQTAPKFQMSDIFTKRRIVLVPLNKGIIGHESAKLLGALLIGQLWTLALSRAGLSPEQRHPVSVYIDEVQDYLKLPGDLSDALSQARGLGVALTLAHQYRSQLPQNLRAAIDANVRNKITFGLSSADAKDMAAMAPALESADFMFLPRYGVYASLQSNGIGTGWVSGKTTKAMPPLRPAYELKAVSMETYGMDAKEVERKYLTMLGYDGNNKKRPGNEPIGRRKREDI